MLTNLPCTKHQHLFHSVSQCPPLCVSLKTSNNLSCSLFLPGLVLDLSSHKNDYASKYLASKGFYVLVEKRTMPSPSNDPNESGLQQEVQYVPLLLRPNETFQGYKARVAERNMGRDETSQTSRNTASRGKRVRLRARKSIVEAS